MNFEIFEEYFARIECDSCKVHILTNDSSLRKTVMMDALELVKDLLAKGWTDDGVLICNVCNDNPPTGDDEDHKNKREADAQQHREAMEKIKSSITVKELIDILSSFPREIKVHMDSYVGGSEGLTADEVKLYDEFVLIG